ncbi:unnamed protein product [Adineta ricciae]|uniref:Uncharacterized protein n=1 Tax=Adineta ricciae TaxID=249248 RepID=A0A815TLP3_ADIRI|nr:unnamed protein product [Adineta ricciae]CAF1548087.1 unnamed protein product [Adineta ricciae]
MPKRERRSQISKLDTASLPDAHDGHISRYPEFNTVDTSSVDPILLILTKEQLKTLAKFAGTPQDDILQWLIRVDEIFDSIQLPDSAKFIAIQSYLIVAALKWFRFNKSQITD